MNQFDPRIHRVVAVVDDANHRDHGQHVHVHLAELASDMQDLPSNKLPPVQRYMPEPHAAVFSRLAEISALLAIASHQSSRNISGYRWYDPDRDFLWDSQKMDADDFIEAALIEIRRLRLALVS